MVFIRPPHLPFPQVWHRFTVQRGGETIPLRVQDLTDDLVEEAVEMLRYNFTRDEPPCKFIEKLLDMMFPQVWHRFTVQSGGETIPLRVQDLTDDLVEEAVEKLRYNFTRDEPPCKFIEINKHPSAVAELEKLWRTAIKDRVSIVCVEDKEDPRMVGVNILAVVCKGDKEEPFHTEDPIWAQLFGAVELVSKGVDVCRHYGVDSYLNAYGLVVDKDWRGMKIGAEILKARIPLCKALGIKVTATVFTAAASQAVARKAGFEDLYEMTYEELARKGCVFPGIEADTKSSKLMAMLIE